MNVFYLFKRFDEELNAKEYAISPQNPVIAVQRQGEDAIKSEHL